VKHKPPISPLAIESLAAHLGGHRRQQLKQRGQSWSCVGVAFVGVARSGSGSVVVVVVIGARTVSGGTVTTCSTIATCVVKCVLVATLLAVTKQKLPQLTSQQQRHHSVHHTQFLEFTYFFIATYVILDIRTNRHFRTEFKLVRLDKTTTAASEESVATYTSFMWWTQLKRSDNSRAPDFVLLRKVLFITEKDLPLVH
jgi:hypothetical protein